MQYFQGRSNNNNIKKFTAPSLQVQNQQSKTQRKREDQNLVRKYSFSKIKLNSLYSKEIYQQNKKIQSLKTVNNQQQQYRSKKNVELNLQVDKQLLQVLKLQNQNLKQQNQFLLQKIRTVQFINKQTKYLFNQQRKQLQKQVQTLQNTIAQLLSFINKEFTPYTQKLLYQIQNNSSQAHFSNKTVSIEKQIIDFNKREFQMDTATTSQKSNALDQLRNKFESLLSSCKKQTDKTKRKEIRQSLCELTIQMRQMRRN